MFNSMELTEIALSLANEAEDLPVAETQIPLYLFAGSCPRSNPLTP